MSLLNKYNNAIKNGNHYKTYKVEMDNGLYCRPRHQVIIGLNAIDNGHDAQQAIEDYIKNSELDNIIS